MMGTKRAGSVIPSAFNMGNCATWLSRIDPSSDFFQDRQSLNDATRRLTRL